MLLRLAGSIDSSVTFLPNFFSILIFRVYGISHSQLTVFTFPHPQILCRYIPVFNKQLLILGFKKRGAKGYQQQEAGSTTLANDGIGAKRW